MHAPIKYAEKALSVAANGLWQVFSRVNKISPNPSMTPNWSDQPVLKSYEKTKPPLGWPRQTDSLCPTCVREARQAILDGTRPLDTLLNEKVGEIKATINEVDGKIVMMKDCPIHGHFEDVMAIDTAFFRHLEEVFPGRDIRAHNDAKLHNHGSSTIKHGRGSVLTVDLTKRSRTAWSSGSAARRRRPTASSSPRTPSSAARRVKRGCGSCTCSSTASATPPTSTGTSRTSST